MATSEYLILALPRFESPTTGPEGSASAHALNAEGELGWEAVGMTVLADGSVAVLFKRSREAHNYGGDRRLLRRLRAWRA